MITKFAVFMLVLTIAFPDILHGITIIHHDRPAESGMSEMAATVPEEMIRKVPSAVFPERQKRLLPYINYYIRSNNQRKPERENFTPFLDSNALPGPFIPIVKTGPKNIQIEYAPEPVPEKNPNYLEIYETLAQLKNAQHAMRHNINQIFSKPVSYVPVQYYDLPPSKTTIETYTPTNIDIDIVDRKKYPTPEVEYKIYRQKPQIVDSYVIEKPVDVYRPQPPKQYYSVRKPIVILERPPEYTQNEKPVAFVDATPKPHVNTITDEQFVAQKFLPIEPPPEAYPKPQPQRVQYATEKPYVQEYFSTPAPQVPTENVNMLAKILKQLQNSNALPQTLTTDNVDNSIKTLVRILNGLRQQEGLKEKPIVVVDDDADEGVVDGEEVVEKPFEKPSYHPASLTQIFPANTIEGGTPGRPGIDYPALSSIPQTDFNCKQQRYKGFFGDPHTNCQVWHYCDLNGGQASFLCPNGTIFSQVALTCDWWYNVKCSTTAQLYVLNERLYKYILPLAPKFPEDYSGPLVDRYLALKFQEMEEKMKKEKKKDDDESEEEEEKDDSDQLQDIQNERAKSGEES